MPLANVHCKSVWFTSESWVTHLEILEIGLGFEATFSASEALSLGLVSVQDWVDLGIGIKRLAGDSASAAMTDNKRKQSNCFSRLVPGAVQNSDLKPQSFATTMSEIDECVFSAQRFLHPLVHTWQAIIFC